MSKIWGVTHCPLCEKPLTQDENWNRQEPKEYLCWNQRCGSTVEERLIEVLTERDELKDRIANLTYLNLGTPCEECGSTDGWVCMWCALEGYNFVRAEGARLSLQNPTTHIRV